MKLRDFLNKGFVGFSYGISFPITQIILDYWLKDCGVSNTIIGIFSLLHLAFLLKFLWAPLIDSYDIPYLSAKFGRRRSWILLSQFLLILGVIGMAHCNPQSGLLSLLFFSSFAAFADGCQNIALYPYQIHGTKQEHFGYLAGTVNFGHRVGTILTKVSALYIAHFFNWKIAYVSMAAMIFICMIFYIFMDEPSYERQNQTTDIEKNAYLSDIMSFFKKHNDIFRILTIIMLYKASDYLLQKMSRPFCMEIGFSKAEIANVVQFFGTISAIVGGVASGYFIKKLGIYKAMLNLGIVHMISMLSYLILDQTGYNMPVLCLNVFLESSTRGCVTAALLSFIYNICQTGSQYAFIWAIHEIGGIFFSAVSGIIVDAIGWTMFFVLAPLAAVPCLLLIYNTLPERHAKRS